MIDLDGVMWRGRAPIDGSSRAVQRLLGRGDRVVFCTNNSMQSGASVRARLIGHGLPDGSEVVTSADAVTTLVQRGEQVLVLGGPGLIDTVRSTGAEVLDAADPAADGRPFDAVVIGLTRDFDYPRLDRASAAVRRGARLIASNTDSTFPAADGLRPGCGSIVAAVEAAAGVAATAAGKPNGPMVDRLRREFPDGAVVIGDRLDTDGELARRLGWPFGLVLSGVTTPSDLPPDRPTAAIAADLATLLERFDADPSLFDLPH